MLKTIQTYIQEYNMISEGDRIVVGVSGGADSVCLFHVLLKLAERLRLQLYVVHVNHGIRGEEADEDEAFVKALCDRHHIAFTAVRADVPAAAATDGLSEEEAGRKIRYEAFYDCLKRNACNKIAIAHNRNDNAETVLFNLFRGSGIKGLTGIPPVREEIIRPLLCVGRNEIESYLKQNGIGYRTDRTNLTEDYSRNKIRHHIIDFAQEEINSGTVPHIANAARQLEEINRYLEKNVMAAYVKTVSFSKEQESYAIDIEKLKQEEVVIQKGILRTVIHRLAHFLKDIDLQHVETVLALTDKGVGKSANLPYGITAVRGYHDITLYAGRRKRDDGLEHSGEEEAYIQEIQAPGDYYLPQIHTTLHVKLINYKKSMIIPQNGYTKWFDYDKIENTVLVRTRNKGDFIQIDSRGGRKKIKTLFIDEKIPREKREHLPLLADGAHIMWVIGGRMSEAYKISEATRLILEISLDGGK